MPISSVVCSPQRTCLGGLDGLFGLFAELSYRATGFTLTIRDHGKGLDQDVHAAGQRERHWGLIGMRERAIRIGGELQIHSAPGDGTAVVTTLRAGLAYQ